MWVQVMDSVGFSVSQSRVSSFSKEEVLPVFFRQKSYRIPNNFCWSLMKLILRLSTKLYLYGDFQNRVYKARSQTSKSRKHRRTILQNKKLNSQAKHKKAQSKASLNKQGEQKLLKNKKKHTHTQKDNISKQSERSEKWREVMQKQR